MLTAANLLHCSDHVQVTPGLYSVEPRIPIGRNPLLLLYELNEPVSYPWAKFPLVFFSNVLKYSLLISYLIQSQFQHIASVLYAVMFYLKEIIIK